MKISDQFTINLLINRIFLFQNTPFIKTRNRYEVTLTLNLATKLMWTTKWSTWTTDFVCGKFRNPNPKTKGKRGRRRRIKRKRSRRRKRRRKRRKRKNQRRKWSRLKLIIYMFILWLLIQVLKVLKICNVATEFI